jgi:hypothetical protein
MKFTREQFEEIADGRQLDVDDLPFSLTREQQFLLFNHLPQTLQGLAIMWGIGDTEWREALMEFMIDNLFGWSIKEYYDSEIAKEYLKKGVKIEFDLDTFINTIANED